MNENDFHSIKNKFNFDLNSIFKVDYEVLSIDLNSLEFFIIYEKHCSSGVYQLSKNQFCNNKLISPWKEDYLRDGNYDPDLEKEFDETNKVFEDDFKTVWVHKMIPEQFNLKFHEKLKEYEEFSDGNTFYFSDFYEWLTDDDFGIFPYDSVQNILETLELSSDSEKLILDEINVDHNGNLISWCSWDEINEEEFNIYFRKK